MSNFLKRTKRAWEENEYDSMRRQYPLNEQECFLANAEPMFNVWKLREVYDYFINKTKESHTADNFFHYLQRLEKDIPLVNQKQQP